jgi:hypothetical protein
LNSILGGGAINEHFETYNIANGSSFSLGSSALNSSTVANGQGPGLVVAGMTISDTSGLQWNGNSLLGLATKSVSGVGPSPSINIAFTQPTTAFGIDLETYQGFPTTISATVFATDNMTTLGTMSGVSVPGPSPVFLGFTSTSGVGSVLLTSSGQTFSVVIDNLTFGVTTVAEPRSVAMLSFGLVAIGGWIWRRRRAA